MVIHEAPQQLWNRVFEESHGISPKINQGVLSTVLKLTKEGSRILEVGPGSGTCAVKLKESKRDVHVVDISKHALTQTQDLAEKNGINLPAVHADGESLPFADRSFEVVYSQGLVEHFNDPNKLLDEMVRVTEESGFVLIDVPQLFSIQHVYKSPQVGADRWQFGWETSYSKKQLIDLMTSHGLKIINEYTYAWGILPPIPKFLKKLISSSNVSRRDYGNPGQDRTWFDTIRMVNATPIHNLLAQYTLNNIGIVGQKK